jgi:hypothetical protein
MKRLTMALPLALAASLALAGTAAAQPISEPASCQGYLASYANPNYAFIIHEIVQPTADDLGVNVGGVLAPIAQLHLGSLEPCIP